MLLLHMLVEGARLVDHFLKVHNVASIVLAWLTALLVHSCLEIVKLTGHWTGSWRCDLRLWSLPLICRHETIPVVFVVELDRGLITFFQEPFFVPGPFKSLAFLFFDHLDLVLRHALIIRCANLFALFLGRRLALVSALERDWCLLTIRISDSGVI
jgi:hypothetical protein